MIRIAKSRTDAATNGRCQLLTILGGCKAPPRWSGIGEPSHTMTALKITWIVLAGMPCARSIRMAWMLCAQDVMTSSVCPHTDNSQLLFVNLVPISQILTHIFLWLALPLLSTHHSHHPSLTLSLQTCVSFWAHTKIAYHILYIVCVYYSCPLWL